MSRLGLNRHFLDISDQKYLTRPGFWTSEKFRPAVTQFLKSIGDFDQDQRLRPEMTQFDLKNDSTCADDTVFCPKII